jgi:hypothetical protein
MLPAAFAVLAMFLIAVGLTVPSAASPRWRRRLPWLLGRAVGGLVGAYLVLRGAAEFFVIDYASPATYRSDWGGPSLAGVFAVHSGPGLAVLIAFAVWLARRHKATKAARPSPGTHLRFSGTMGR